MQYRMAMSDPVVFMVTAEELEAIRDNASERADELEWQLKRTQSELADVRAQLSHLLLNHPILEQPAGHTSVQKPLRAPSVAPVVVTSRAKTQPLGTRLAEGSGPHDYPSARPATEPTTVHLRPPVLQPPPVPVQARQVRASVPPPLPAADPPTIVQPVVAEEPATIVQADPATTQYPRMRSEPTVIRATPVALIQASAGVPLAGMPRASSAPARPATANVVPRAATARPPRTTARVPLPPMTGRPATRH
jgi:hypothetical protein